MSYVKLLNLSLSSRSLLLTIRASTSFRQTINKIKKAKQIDFIVVEKPKPAQMAAILITRLSGHKFFWVQNFQNPPVPSLATKILLNQADRIVVANKTNYTKAIKLGLDKKKIRFLENSRKQTLADTLNSRFLKHHPRP